MKYTLKRALALLIALLLAMPTFAFAEEPSGEIIALEDVLAGDGEAAVPDLEPEITELEDASLELPDLDIDLPLEGLIQEDAGEPVQDSVVSWRFIVGDALYAVQEAREGDLILRPEDPAAPQGQALPAGSRRMAPGCS